MTTAQTILTTYIQAIIESLHQQKLKNIVIAPGSRSTPVALLLAQAAPLYDFKLYVDVDERSAGFLALGLAKTSHQPTLLLCTSGTAAANFYPAIIEAKLTHQPLIVLTTDRPPELTNIGAPQAIDQNQLYGTHVKAFLQLPLPTDQPDTLKYVTFSVQRLYLQSQQVPMGPVHLNLPLRKPLMPDLTEHTQPAPVKTIHQPKMIQTLAPETLLALKQTYQDKRILVVAGPEETPYDHQTLYRLIQKMNWPVLADPLSQLRGHLPDLILTGGDCLLKEATLSTTLYPDRILRFGATPVSASLANWLANSPVPIDYLDPNQALADHTKASTQQLSVTLDWFFDAFTPEPTPKQTGYTKKWQRLQTDYHQLVQTTFAHETLTEGSVPYWFGQTATTGQLFISNSMPIRDFDDYYAPQTPVTTLYCNRGANGIDGVVSTALGMHLAAAKKPSYLVIGDLAFFHDMNGLMLAKRYHLSLTIIIINNNGGGIFSFLPQAKAPAYFEQLFGTPQDLDVQAVAELYQAQYEHPQDSVAFKALLAKPTQGLRLIEITTERSQNLQAHRHFQATVKKMMEADFENHSE